MDLYNEIVTTYFDYLIKGIFISVLIIILCKSIFKNKIEVLYSVKLIRYLLIAFTLATLIKIALNLALHPEEMIRWKKHFSGPYWFTYLFMTTMVFLPLVLVTKKPGSNLWFILAVSVLINIGWLFESFVIHMTSINMDYELVENPYFPSYREIRVILRGIFLGIIILIFDNVLITYGKHKRYN
jgi:hypothetical protein